MDYSALIVMSMCLGFLFLSSTPFKVLATLVSTMFTIPSLNWENPIDHFETFSGAMEVTKHEWLDWGVKGLFLVAISKTMMRFYLIIAA